jgi:(S)-sulfolactate dehydrogenase
MADVVVAEFMDEAVVADLVRRAETLYAPDLVDRPDELAQAVRGARALIVRNRTQVRGALLADATRLRAVGRLGVGLDNIDVAACRDRGITVIPATGANDDAVAEYVVCMAMLLLRRAYLASAEVAAGGWPRNALVGRELAGKRVGFVGFGGIARRAATLLSALGMRVAATDPHLPLNNPAWNNAERMKLDALLASVDVVSVHVPLTDETRGLIGIQAIAAMRPDAVLINTARGGVVDEAALAEALRAGRLGGAALDVFAEEPLGAAAGARFAGIPNLVLTPHIAGVTVESNARVSALVRDRVLQVLENAA